MRFIGNRDLIHLTSIDTGCADKYCVYYKDDLWHKMLGLINKYYTGNQKTLAGKSEEWWHMTVCMRKLKYKQLQQLLPLFLFEIIKMFNKIMDHTRWKHFIDLDHGKKK